jgi:hypothetical protein
LNQHSIPLRSVASGRRTTTAGRASRRGRGDGHRGGREQDGRGYYGCGIECAPVDGRLVRTYFDYLMGEEV